MIFVTVGHQMPFDRLVRTVDEWAGDTGRSDIFAQIGDTVFQPRFISYDHRLAPKKFNQCIEKADAIIAHAGTGTILTALEMGKPILVMPRRAKLLETRNDHQVATARYFREIGKTTVAMNENELRSILDDIKTLKSNDLISSHASTDLISAIKNFIIENNK